MIHHEQPQEPVKDACEQRNDEAGSKQSNALQDAATQEAYRKAHLEQLRRLQCPGCGETEIF